MKRAILITARLKSKRLPLKVIRKIKDKTMIEHMLDRLKLSKKVDQIIICTSNINQDKPLIEIADNNNVSYFLGDPDDVLVRLLNAATQFQVDTIINCTADNPFVDPEYIDKLIEYHEKHNNDFSKIEGLPFGVFSYAIKRQALEKVCHIKKNRDTEVWHGYFTNTDIFKWSAMMVEDPKLFKPNMRLTVDTPEDFMVIKIIFDELYNDRKIFSLQDIVQFLEAKPEILKLNANIIQKKAPPLKIKGDKRIYEA